MQPRELTSRTPELRPSILKNLCLSLIVTGLVCALAAPTLAVPGSVPTPDLAPTLDTIEVDAAYRWSPPAGDDFGLVAVTVPEAGRLAVQVDTSPGEAPAWIEILPSADHAFTATRFGEGVVEILAPTVVYLRVGRVAGPELGGDDSLRLVTRHFPLERGSLKDGGGGGGGSGEGGGGGGGGGNGTETEEGEILPIWYPDDPWLALCGIEPADDLFLCARPLSFDVTVTAELDALLGDDRDHYFFVVDTAGTVEISTTGTTDTYGTLYDGFGDQLAADDDSGVGDNFALSVSLAAGHYFVRVEGTAGSEGQYQITVEQP